MNSHGYNVVIYDYLRCLIRKFFLVVQLKAKLARKKSTSKKPSAANLAAAEVKARAKKKGSKKDKTKFNQVHP